jgi:hypothetical protein
MRPIGWQNAGIPLQSWRRTAAYYGQCKREHPTALGEAEISGNAVSVSWLLASTRLVARSSRIEQLRLVNGRFNECFPRSQSPWFNYVLNLRDTFARPRVLRSMTTYHREFFMQFRHLPTFCTGVEGRSIV